MAAPHHCRTEMKVSIITTTYNSSRTVEDTIKSVLSQTYKDYEYLIVDGASNDNTLEIVREYEPQFEGRMRIYSENDKGIYDAMNKGFQKAIGDLLMLINSDDLFARPDAVKLVVDEFEKNPDIDGVYANLYYVSQNNTDNIIRVWKTGEQKPMRYGWLPAHPTFYVKRECYEKYGYFNLNYALAADFELMLRFVERHGIKLTYLPEFLVKMRLGGATSKNLRNIYKQGIETIKAFKDNGLSGGTVLYLFWRYLPKIMQFIKVSE